MNADGVRVSEKMEQMDRMMNKKAKYGEPCSRCGICCGMQLCPIALLAFPSHEPPCMALSYSRELGIFQCDLVALEEQESELRPARKVLGIGTGCSMPDADTTEEEIEAQDRKAFRQVYGYEMPEEPSPQ